MAFMFLPAMHAAGSFGALPQQTTEPPPDWPEGSAAYDHMVTMTEFGYRRIDTQANFDARNWVASELEAMGHDVERQPFTTQECSNVRTSWSRSPVNDVTNGSSWVRTMMRSATPHLPWSV